MPPLAQVEDFAQTVILVKELSLMNEQTGINSFFNHGLNDLIEWNDFVFEVRRVNAQGEKCTGQSARDGNRDPRNIGRAQLFGGNKDWPVVVANRSAVRQQRVL